MIKLARKVLCVDWDDRSLRLVVARTGSGQMTLEDAHSHLLPEEVEPGNSQSLGGFIRQMLRQHHWHYKRVVVDIPRERAVINRLLLPPTPLHELAAAVRFQAMKELPFPLEEAIVDYVVMKRDERGLATEVLLAAVTQDTLATVQATCEAAGLVPARIGLRPYANLVSIKHIAGLAEQRILFVDVGPSMSEIDVMEAGKLAFARSANVNVPLPAGAGEEDSRIHRQPKLAVPEISDEEMELAVNELVVEITRTLQAYRASEPGAPIDRIVIAGGTGIEEQLAQVVGQRFELDTELFDPTMALGVAADEVEKLRSFSAALGMAWGLSREGLLEIDFLNPKRSVPAGETWKRRLRIGGIAAGLVLAGALATDITLYLRKCEVLAGQETEVRNLKDQLKRYLQIENMVEGVADWQCQAIWPEHLLVLTENAVEPGKDMLVQQMAFNARNAAINMMKVQATHMDVTDEYVSQVNSLKDSDDTRPYLVVPGSWRTRNTRDSKFKGAVDLQVELRDLKKHLEGHDQRVKARNKKIRGL